MKNLTIAILLSVFIYSCSKDDPISINDNTLIEISYYDWNPDTLIIDSVLIDLNNDNLNDVKFLIEKNYQGSSPSGGSYYNYFARCLSINPELKISLGKEVNSSQQEWDCLKFDSIISNDLKWQNSAILNGQVIVAGAVGIWDTNNSEGYIGLRFESNQSTNFGWIKISVNSNAFIVKRYEITCFEYGISETGNSNIKAGQKE